MPSVVFSLVRDAFPSRSARWVNDVCRAGKVPGARKIGGAWFWTPADAEAFAKGEAANDARLTVEQAADELRRMGCL